MEWYNDMREKTEKVSDSQLKPMVYLIDGEFHEDLKGVSDYFNPAVVLLENFEFPHEVFSYFYSALCLKVKKMFFLDDAFEVLNPQDIKVSKNQYNYRGIISANYYESIEYVYQYMYPFRDFQKQNVKLDDFITNDSRHLFKVEYIFCFFSCFLILIHSYL